MTIKRRTCVNCGKEIWYGRWLGIHFESEKHWYHTHSNNTDCMLHAEPDRP